MQTGNEKVLIAGAGGTLGLPLTRRLVLAGYDVVGLTRSKSKLPAIEASGATAVAGDALDAASVRKIVERERPGQVVNVLTALPAGGPLRPADLRPTNRLRREGSANLLDAALEAGVRRVVAESFVAAAGTTASHRPLREDDPLDAVDESDPLKETIEALRDLERQHQEIGRQGKMQTVVLRYGFFYGPGVPSTDLMIRNLTRGRMFAPRVGGAASWIHIEDAVSATLAVLQRPHASPLYHVCDDLPVSIAEALEAARRALGTRGPRTVPGWILRLLAPMVERMNSLNLALDNGRIRRELGWRPQYPSVREGFEHLAREQFVAA